MINPPYVFYAGWKIVSAVIDPVTVKKINIISGSDYKPLLLELIDPENIPNIYGGKGTDELPEVPKSEASMTQLDVGARAKVNVDIEVNDERAVLEYKWHVAKNDVIFSVIQKKKASGETKEIVVAKKYTPENSNKDTIRLDDTLIPGIVSLYFDNSYRYICFCFFLVLL